MKRIPLLFVLGAFALATGPASAASCENERVAEIDLQMLGSDVLVPAKVGGKDAYFALRGDSGVPVLLHPGVEALGLKARVQNGTGQFTSGEQRVRYTAKMEQIQLGDFRMADRTALVEPGTEGEELPIVDGRPVVGAMGSTLFQYMDIELDLADRKLRVFKPFACRKRSPVYWAEATVGHPMHFDATGMLVFNLELEGRRIQSSLLSGTSSSSIDVKATRQFFGFDDSSPGLERVRTASGDERAVFRAMSLTGKGLSLPDAPVQLRPGPDCKLSESVPIHGSIGYGSCVNVVPFTLGTDALKQLRVYTSRERQQIYFTRK